jgi:dolichol kinase
LKAKSELARQIIHILLGMCAIGGMLILWKLTHGWHYIAISIAWLALITYCTVIYLHSRGAKTPFDALFTYMGKRDSFPGEGALWYLLGIMLALSFLDRFLYVIASIYILSVGDSISTIYSYKNKYVQSFFKGRSWISYLAFIIFTIPISLYAGVLVIPLILICTIAESLDLKINDNFLIPLICVIYFRLI